MIACVMCARNEERYLPSFFEHFNPYVDGYVVLDDGSTNRTDEILEANSKVTEIIRKEVTNVVDWDEASNRIEALNRAKELGFDWVLYLDPDERLQAKFLKKLRQLTATTEIVAYDLHFREC